jgi:hypothetical protein
MYLLMLVELVLPPIESPPSYYTLPAVYVDIGKVSKKAL